MQNFARGHNASQPLINFMQAGIPRVDICTLSDYKEDDIMVSRFSDYLRDHSNLVFPHRHSFYHLVFFTKGAGTHTIDFERFDVKPFQIYFMVPGQVHTWHFEGETDGYLVNFSTSFFRSFLLKPEYLDGFHFLNGSPGQSVLNLSGDVAEKTNLQFEDLVHHARTEHVMRNDLIRVMLLQIFLILEKSRSLQGDQKMQVTQNALIKNFQKLVETNFSHLRLPGEYASLLAVSPNHLNALSKENLGMQAGEVIRQRLLLEAKRLLISADLSISQIAYELNFNDNSYFTKFFRKQAGMSPEEFRKKGAA